MIEEATAFDELGGERTLEAVLCRVLEQQLNISGIWKDPSDPELGPDGRLWDAMSGDGEFRPWSTEEELARCRRIASWLYWAVPWARAAHENRISYVIGFGHVYSVAEKEGKTASDAQKERVNEWLKEWQKRNKWGLRQRNNQRDGDMQGEVFLRKFKGEDGYLIVKLIAPGAVKQPQDKTDPQYSFGVETDPEDVETVLRYWVNDKPIEAAEIQHRKYNCGSLDKRGTPLLWSWRHNFDRAGRMIRNGSKVTEIQTAYAVIKKVADSMARNVQAWGAMSANTKVTTTIPGAGTGADPVNYHQQVKPGSIVTITKEQEIELPGIGIDPTKYVEAVAGEMRAVAAALVMPEFMLTADASNNNRASAIVAGDPSDQNFLRLQQETIEWDLELINEAAQYAIEKGLIQEGDLEVLEIKATGPAITQRDKLKEAQTRQTDINCGILSKQTATAESGRDYETEQNNIEQHNEKYGDDGLNIPLDGSGNPMQQKPQGGGIGGGGKDPKEKDKAA